MEKTFIVTEKLRDEVGQSFGVNEKGQSYVEWIYERNMENGSKKLKDAILRFLKERESGK